MWRLAGVLVGIGGAALAAWAAPAGRVVRVERTHDQVAPRLCAMSVGPALGICVGKVEPGERMYLVDPTAKTVEGEFRIDGVSEATDFCSKGTPNLWKITGVVTEGNPDILDRGETIGLRGISMKRSAARVIANQPAPSGRTTDKVLLTLDSDGNGRADVVLVRYTCDNRGYPTTATEQTCIDTYMERSARLERVHQDIIEPCN